MTDHRTPIEHGTVAGWWKHRRRGIPYCPACSKAWAEYNRAARRKPSRKQEEEDKLGEHQALAQAVRQH